MKLFKKLAAACLALTFCFSLATLVACGDKDGNTVTSSTDSSSPVVEDSSDSADSEISSEVGGEVSDNSSIVDDSTDSEVSSEVGGEVSDAPVAQANAYNFIIKNADGSAAVGYAVQMCTTDGRGICYQPSNATGNVSDENGFIYLEMGSMSCPSPAVYEVHVMLDGVQVNLSSVVNTPAEVSLDFIILTLA